MKATPVLIALSIINMAGLAYVASQARPAQAAAPNDGIIRGKALQITDDKGMVRASISVMPAQKLKDGSTYPETVLLRLISGNGRPTVKISALDDGSGMSLGSGEGQAYAQILARKGPPEINLVDESGKKLAR